MPRITGDDPGWPRGLFDLTDPPPFLEVEGAFPVGLPTVAIVGTRHATDEALDVTRSIAATLAGAGVLVISGGAYGIDAAAHEGALSVERATVAVLGTPLDQLYPKDHRPLFERVLVRGALVSEQPHGGPVRPAMFVARNRLIAAAADVCLVVQAPIRSGALSTAACAHELGRPLFACPWSPLEERARGGVALIASGRARLARDAGDLMDALGVLRAPAPPERKRGRRNAPGAPPAMKPAPSLAATQPRAPAADPERARVLSALGRTAVRPDELAAKLAMPLSRLLPVLLDLELDGAVTKGPSGYRRA